MFIYKVNIVYNLVKELFLKLLLPQKTLVLIPVRNN